MVVEGFEGVAERARFWLLLGAIAAIGPVAVYANNGTVPILIVSCLAMPHLRRAVMDVRLLLKTPCGLALVTLVGWSLLSTSWAPGGIDALIRGGKVAAIMLAGVLFIAAIRQMNNPQRRALATAFLVAAALSVTLVIVEFATGGTALVEAKAAQSSRFVYLSDLIATAAPFLAVLVWPVAATLYQRTGRWLLPLAAVTLTAFTLSLLPLASTLVALILGALTFIAVYACRRAIVVVGIVFAVYVLVGPFVSAHVINLDTVGPAGETIPTSWQHRLEIWRFTATKALERPVFGHGFDASREIGRDANPITIWNPDRSGRNYVDKGLPLHPHNAALQVWLELGLVGAVIIIAGVTLTLVWVGRRTVSALSRAMAAAGLTAFLAIELLAYGVWQSWWHAAAWLMAGAVLVAANETNRGASA